MITRFSLYGFLKNQRYFEPFLVLALMDAGLDFTQIGVLIAVRELAVNLLEVPSGAIADVAGRRRSMVLSFVAYIVSFALFATSSTMPFFVLAMALYGAGDAFRSGTHKAMILTWLRAEGRIDERVAVYGQTRSWSKIGSAVSAPIATAIVLAGVGYSWVFAAAIVPYALNLANLATYPASLDGGRSGTTVRTHLAESLRAAWSHRPTRRVLAESLSMGGLYKSIKDYVQPTAATAAHGIPVLLFLSADTRSAVLIGAVYVALFGLEALASRRAASFAEHAGGSVHAARSLWFLTLAVVAVLAAGLALDLGVVAIAAFIALAGVFNLYRPILVSRLDALSDDVHSATVLSVEAQGRALATMVLAPLIGLAVDRAGGAEGTALWPVGLIALVLVGVTVVGLLPNPAGEVPATPEP